MFSRVLRRSALRATALRRSFRDRIRLDVEAGHGGDGSVSFNRTSSGKAIPDGGNGGDGGDVFLVGNRSMQSFRFQSAVYRAQSGKPGRGSGMHGKSGQDVHVDIPCGTQVYEVLSKHVISSEDLPPGFFRGPSSPLGTTGTLRAPAGEDGVLNTSTVFGTANATKLLDNALRDSLERKGEEPNEFDEAIRALLDELEPVMKPGSSKTDSVLQRLRHIDMEALSLLHQRGKFPRELLTTLRGLVERSVQTYDRERRVLKRRRYRRRKQLKKEYGYLGRGVERDDVEALDGDWGGLSDAELDKLLDAEGMYPADDDAKDEEEDLMDLGDDAMGQFFRLQMEDQRDPTIVTHMFKMTGKSKHRYSSGQQKGHISRSQAMAQAMSGGEDSGESTPKSGGKGDSRTVVFRSRLLADISRDKQELKICRGGKGGEGNTAYKGQDRMEPIFASKGERGEGRSLLFVLKMMADVGLVGLPNAGKSSFLDAVSRAAPKVAAYPFTTLHPTVGMVSLAPPQHESWSGWDGLAHDDYLPDSGFRYYLAGEECVLGHVSPFDLTADCNTHIPTAMRRADPFSVADIPGLVEGAHVDRGLGHDFLRHIERTQANLFVTAAMDSLSEKGDVQWCVNNLHTVVNELREYGGGLHDRPSVILCNKADLDPDLAHEAALELSINFPQWPVYTGSTMYGPVCAGVQGALWHLRLLLDETGRGTDASMPGSAVLEEEEEPFHICA